MSHPGSKIETEIKLRLPDAGTGRDLLTKAGFHVSVPRIFEQNILYDTADASLRNRGVVLRLRRAGDKTTLTLKGAPVPAKHKSREEHEVTVSDFASFQSILQQLGYIPVFQYDKYRTEFAGTDLSGTATLDETPIGVFLELEGPPDWIDEMAKTLGFSELSYIVESYGKLYLDYCRQHPSDPQKMTF